MVQLFFKNYQLKPFKMKSLFYLLSLVILFFFGCEKEKNALNDTNNYESLDYQNFNEIFAFNLNGEGQLEIINKISLSDLESINKSKVSTRSKNYASANGHFNTPFGSTMTFSAIENMGGTHGQIHLVNASLDVQMNTTCVAVYENKAVFQGEISSINEGSFYKVGNTLMIYVEDFGEGAKSPLDRYSSNLYYLKTSDPTYLFDCQLWLHCSTLCWGNSIEVANRSDQIQVK